MGIFHSLQLIFLTGAVIINLLLAFLVFASNPKSATNILFGILSFVISAWLVVIYLAPNPAYQGLVLIRLSTFLAAPMSLLFFLLAHTLPNTELQLKKKTFNTFLVVTEVIMLINISPYTFTSLQIINNVEKPVPGPGILPFGLLTTFFSLGAVFLLYKKFKNSAGAEKQQFRLILTGIILMLGLIILTIFIPVAIFHVDTLVPFSPLYTLIFLGFTAYAIVKHKLFDVKVIATQAITVILWIMLFAKIVVARTGAERISDVFIFLASLIFGHLLIQSVKKEVEQRELLEVLTKKLEDANEQLKALDKARAEFISIASHQLRTPPATIKWFLSSILTGDYGKIPKGLQEILEKTNRTNNSQISLIDDMLNVSRIERGKMEFLFQPSDLLEMAKTTYEQLEPMAKEKGLKLGFVQPKEKLPLLMADKEKLRQVMNNMIDNALKYTKQGSVTAELSKNNNEIIFSVTDTGKGIADEDRSSIFEKFSRGKESIKQSAGLGLGLYVAKVIIEQHKGKIWAESAGEGKGSKFIFSLPINSGLKETTLVDLAQNQK